MEEKDYTVQLKALAQKRDDVENVYRQNIRHIEDVNYDISRQSRLTQEMTNNNPILNTNRRLQAIYGERDAVFRNMRQHNEDFNDAAMASRRNELSKLDDEEEELKKLMKQEDDDNRDDKN